jgi:pimeloyl-ACP methyl ester carboxylesterase
MATFLIIHGAWSAGWAWTRFRPLLRERGHEVFTPTCTGLGERAHLASPQVSLDTHIADMLAVLDYEDLHDVVLVGHSYGGMVATGVADRAAARIAQLVYLDAFVPQDGQSAFDLIPPKARDRNQDQARRDGDGWLLPANPLPPDTDPADVAWALPRRRMQPIGAFSTPVRLSGAVNALPRSYIYCTRSGPGDVFRPFADRARDDAAWQYFELDASHNPHFTMPATLADLLHRIAKPGASPTDSPTA